MFDKLVESSSTGADLGPRRRIFVASFFFVAVLFATAVVVSIYAADFDLGANNFDIAEPLTPVTETEPPREAEPEQTHQNSQTAVSDRTTRVMNIQRIDEIPVTTPPVSTARSPYLSRPIGDFIINPRGVDSNGVPSDSEGRPEGKGSGSPSEITSFDSEAIKAEPPPPVRPSERKLPPRSLGVITGKASYLPKPPYPQMAKAVGAGGPVNVQVTIDENGNVISAKAVSGHLMLRQVSEEAARKAKFSPTTLSEVPVKVTGIIVYNFTRN